MEKRREHVLPSLGRDEPGSSIVAAKFANLYTMPKCFEGIDRLSLVKTSYDFK